LYSSSFLTMTMILVESYPHTREIKNTYQGLANYYQLAVGAGAGESFDFDISSFARSYNMKPVTVMNSIKILEQNGWIAGTESVFMPSRIMVIVRNEELYKFEVANRNQEMLIKLMLRSYPGVFEDYVKINEQELADQLNITKQSVIRYLKFMQGEKIINYEAQKDQPQIIFLKPRADIKNLTLDKKLLNFRKKTHAERVNAILHYATNKATCRSQMLLAYFGEDQAARCGVCDLCLQRNRLALSDIEYNNIVEQVKSELNKHPLVLKDLVRNIKDAKQEKVLKTIHWLKDNHQLQENEQNQLIWHK